METQDDIKNNPGEIDYNRKWYVMAAVAMGIFLATIDSSIINVALPTLVRQYKTDFATVQWVILAYLLTLATLLLSVGRLADMRGKKPIYGTGFFVFTAGSILCGFAPTIYWLIFFRIVQAVGATMILALGMAIVTEAFPASERGKALGITGSMVSIGIVIGPTIGGIIIDALSWNWIFFVNIPVGIIGIWMVVKFVPNLKPIGKQRFDVPGAVFLFISLLSLLIGLTLGQQQSFIEFRVLILFFISIIFFGIFIWQEFHTDQPMIDLDLFKNKIFSISLATGFLTFFTIAGTIILMPFYLENNLGYETRQVGLMLAVVPIAMGVVSPISGSLSDRFGSRVIAVLGLIILLVGYYAISQLKLTTTMLEYILRFLPIGLGMGVFQSPNNSTIMGHAPRNQLGVVSGMLAINRTIGQTIGIAILGALWASRIIFYSNSSLNASGTNAVSIYQVLALHDTFIIVFFIILVALVLSIWGLLIERNLQTYKKNIPL